MTCPFLWGILCLQGNRALHTGDKKMTTTTTTYLCTNGNNSSFRIDATDIESALSAAARRFDAECSYILPIMVESEDGDIADIY